MINAMDSRNLFSEGQSHMLNGQLEIAESKFREAISCLDVGHWEIPHFRFELALCLHLQHRHEEGDKEISHNFPATSSRDVRIDIPWLRAECCFARQEYQDAGDLYWNAVELAIEIDSDYFTYDYDIEVFTNMLTCFYLLGNPVKAEQILLHLKFDADSTAELLLEIAERHTAEYYEFAGLPGQMPVDSCASCLRHSIKLKPQAKAFAMLGRHFQMGNQPSEAVAVFSEMNSQFSADFDEVSSRSFGWALQALDSLVEAEYWLRKSALDFYPDDLYEVDPLITFYGQYQRWGDAREVIENYLSAQMFKPKSELALRDAYDAWSLHARCCELLGDFKTSGGSRSQANMHREHFLRERIAKGEFSALSHYELGFLLKSEGRSDEAESLLLIAEQEFFAATQEGKNNWWGHHWLGLLHEERGSLIESDAHFREAFRVYSGLYSSPELDIGRVLFKSGFIEESESHLRVAFDKSPDVQQKYWLGKCLLELGQVAEAKKLLTEVAHDGPFDADYAAALEACRLASETLRPPTSEIDFSSFVDAGRFWLEPALFRTTRTGLLARLFDDGAEWADSSYVLFTDFGVSDDDLDDALARAVAVSRQIHLAPEMPVKLQTEKLEVLLDLEGQFLRAWVGRNQVGVSVSVDISTWELFYAPGDRDAMFAAGVAINWFLDCSIALTTHPKFQQLAPSESTSLDVRGTAGNVWTVQSQFDSDVEQILSGRIPAPPKAHRVRGHIRRLGDGLPSDDARENAPPYIRRHMSPDETWVRGHSRGGDTTGVTLLSRLHTYSSLADFLATAKRA